MTDRITRPEGATYITTYQEFERYVEAFAEEHLNLLVLIGRLDVDDLDIDVGEPLEELEEATA